MHDAQERQHLYARDPIDPSGSDSLAVIARMVQPGSTVLDIGCSTGELGRYLTEQRECIVDGLDHNAAALALAKQYYRTAVLADLNNDPLEALIGQETYDYIVCADIIEHLLNPDALIDQMKGHLTPRGQILFSVPNITYIGVILELMFGQFSYRDDGILDRTHLHFFSRGSLTQLLENHDLSVVASADIVLELAYSEFSQYLVSNLSHEELNPLLERADTLTYQFVFATTPITENQPWAGETFPKQQHHTPRLELGLVWKTTDDRAFTNTNRMVRSISFTDEQQTVHFPVDEASSTTELALDTYNQPGHLGIHEISLWQDELLLWQQTFTDDRWLSSPDPTVIDGRHAGALTASLARLITDHTERLELPVPPPLLAAASTLSITLTWRTLREHLNGLQSQLLTVSRQNHSLWNQLADSKDDESLDANSQLRRQLRQAHSRKRYEHLRHHLNERRLEAMLVDLAQNRQQAIEQVTALQATYDDAVNSLGTQLQQLEQALQSRDRHLASIYASTSWRLGEPLRAFGARIPSPLRRILTSFLRGSDAPSPASTSADTPQTPAPSSHTPPAPLYLAPQPSVDPRVVDIYAPALRARPSENVSSHLQDPTNNFDFPITLVIDSIWPQPDHDAGSLFIINQLEALQRLGHQVVFSPTAEPERPSSYRRALEEHDILCPVGVEFPSLEALLTNNEGLFDVIVLSRVNCGGRFYEQVRQHNSRAKIIFCPIDLHGVRELREGRLHLDQGALNKARTTLERELYLTRNTDATVVVSEAEHAYLAHRVPGANVFHSPVLTHLDKEVPSYSQRRHTIGIIGNFRHLPNIDAVEILLNELWPLLSARDPNLCLEIVGDSLPHQIQDSLEPRVTYLGHLPTLDSWLASIKATVAPLRFGAGAKGKIVTSLSAGVPCVTTQIGAEGMKLVADKEIAIAETNEHFVELLLTIVHEPATWDRYSTAGLTRMKDDYSPGIVLAAWHDMLRSIGAPVSLEG
jgi:2-polyprenyl-3-methyl-5-hydroxy-6-metoxy-1,4-benzoquinol methylase/glycosyltransferase involved in cell wall biosynthesis